MAEAACVLYLKDNEVATQWVPAKPAHGKGFKIGDTLHFFGVGGRVRIEFEKKTPFKHTGSGHPPFNYLAPHGHTLDLVIADHATGEYDFDCYLILPDGAEVSYPEGQKGDNVPVKP